MHASTGMRQAAIALAMIAFSLASRAADVELRLTSTSLLMLPSSFTPVGEAPLAVTFWGSGSLTDFSTAFSDQAATHELAADPSGGEHRSPISFSRGTTLVESGVVLLRLPAADADGDLLPDLVDLRQGVTANVSGSASTIRPPATPNGLTISLQYTVTGMLTRNAGELGGRYSLRFVRNDAVNFVIEGVWRIRRFDPDASRFSYERGQTEKR